MNKNFLDFMQNYKGQKLAVAVSGGVDSICLLCWLADLKMDVTALHVNHRLRKAADEETEYVKELCKKLGVPCQIFYWEGEKPEAGLEAAARNARYKMMTDFCLENNIDALMVAHQADDQIETFLMNLARGSGLYGLSAMRPVSYRDGVKIVRPLLKVYRKELKQYCEDNGIKYYTDEMNKDPHYTRVRIRQNRYLLAEKLGISDARILLAIDNLNRSRDALDVQISSLVSEVIHKDYALFLESFLFDLAPDIRLKFFGTLIQKIGENNYPARLNSLASALDKLKFDCKFTLGHCTVRRLGEKILIVPEGAKTSFRKKYEKYKRNEEKKLNKE